jgi:hypothetical protein
MSFPLSIFLYIYLVFLLIWFIFSIIGVYHMLKYGFLNFMTFFSVFLYFTVSVAMLLVSYNFISGIDWNLNITIFKDFLSPPDNNFFK